MTAPPPRWTSPSPDRGRSDLLGADGLPVATVVLVGARQWKATLAVPIPGGSWTPSEVFSSRQSAMTWAEEAVRAQAVAEVTGALVRDADLGRWRLLPGETTPSGKQMFSCLVCGRKTPAPTVGTCRAGGLNCQAEWERRS